MHGRVIDTVLLLFLSKTAKRAIASISGMENRINSRMSESGRDRGVPSRWEEVVVAVLRMAGMFEQ